LSKVTYKLTVHTLWTASDFRRLQLHKYNNINVQQILVVTFEFTGAALGFMIMSCAARGFKKVGQHCHIVFLPFKLIYKVYHNYSRVVWNA